MVSPEIKIGLTSLSNQRVYFGHQSIGDNLLSGLRLLSADAGVPLQITELADASKLKAGMLGHVYLDENTQPFKKLSSFEASFASLPAGPGTMLMKFCYIDFNSETDVSALFSGYEKSIEKMRLLHRDWRIVHVTVPLTVVEQGWKGTVKRWMNRAPYGLLENKKRNDFNALLKSRYSKQDTVFDLARAESTRPDGSAVTFVWNEMVVPALEPAYASDGQHLNEMGQRRVAAEFVRVLTENK